MKMTPGGQNIRYFVCGTSFSYHLCWEGSPKTVCRVLAVLVNSVYSFWWDVANDWGLSLLSPYLSLPHRIHTPEHGPGLPYGNSSPDSGSTAPFSNSHLSAHARRQSVHDPLPI